MLLSGNFSLTIANAQITGKFDEPVNWRENYDNEFRNYDRGEQAIIIFDATELIPVDTLPVKELLEMNRAPEPRMDPRNTRGISNEEIFYLMEEEEKMREMRDPE